MFKSMINPSLLEKKSLILLMTILLFASMSLSAGTKTLKCKSTIVNLTFKNVKIKKVKFTDETHIRYETASDSFKVKTKISKDKVSFESSKKGARISLYLPKGKSYKVNLKDKTSCSFDYRSISADTGTGEKIYIENGTVKVLNEKGKQILSIGNGGIYVNDDTDVVRIDQNGLYIKSDDELKNYSGFWAKLLAKTITGITDLAMDISLKDIGKNVKKIINEQNFRIIGNKINSISGNFSFSNDNFQKEIKKDFNIKEKTELNIETFNGDVTIDSTSSTWLKIDIIVGAPKENDLENIKVDVEKQDNEINVRVYKADQLIKGGADIIVSLPRNVSIRDIESSNGKITVNNSQGKLNVISSNGKINVKNFKGDIAVLTSNAKIKIKNVTGKANLVSSNGDIDGRNITRMVNAKTSNADIDLIRIKIAGDIKTSNGDITLSTNDLYNHTDIKTSNGSIILSIPQNIDLSIEAVTSNDGVRVDDLNFKNIKSDNNSLSGILGTGSKNVKLTTSNSKITIKNKRRSK